MVSIKSEIGSCKNNMEIIYRGHNEHYLRPEIGDRYILHKPENTSETPNWVDGMDKYDGDILLITDEYKDGRHPIDRKSWDSIVERTVDMRGYLVNLKWLEKVNEYEELSDFKFEIADLF